MSVFTIVPEFEVNTNARGRRWLDSVFRAGFDDLTAGCGVLAATLAALTVLVPEMAVVALMVGLLGAVFGLAARQSLREGSREDSDHPGRLRVGTALCLASLLVGMAQVVGVVAMLPQALNG